MVVYYIIIIFNHFFLFVCTSPYVIHCFFLKGFSSEKKGKSSKQDFVMIMWFKLWCSGEEWNKNGSQRTFRLLALHCCTKFSQSGKNIFCFSCIYTLSVWLVLPFTFYALVQYNSTVVFFEYNVSWNFNCTLEFGPILFLSLSLSPSLTPSAIFRL